MIGIKHKVMTKIVILQVIIAVAILTTFGFASSAYAQTNDAGTEGDTNANPSTAVFTATDIFVDFEACPTGFNASYTEDGVLVDLAVVIGDILCTPAFATQTVLGGPIAGPWDQIRSDLGCTTDAVSAGVGDFGQDTETMFLEGYTSGDVLVDSDSITTGAAGLNALSVSGPGIAYILTGSDGPFPNSVFTDNIRFTCPSAVGGEFIPLDATMVLVAGTHTAAAWMIPVIISAIGIGIVISRKF